VPDFNNKVKPGGFGRAMGIYIDHEKHLLLGAADPRSADGLAAGF